MRCCRWSDLQILRRQTQREVFSRSLAVGVHSTACSEAAPKKSPAKKSPVKKSPAKKSPSKRPSPKPVAEKAAKKPKAEEPAAAAAPKSSARKMPGFLGGKDETKKEKVESTGEPVVDTCLSICIDVADQCVLLSASAAAAPKAAVAAPATGQPATSAAA